MPFQSKLTAEQHFIMLMTTAHATPSLSSTIIANVSSPDYYKSLKDQLSDFNDDYMGSLYNPDYIKLGQLSTEQLEAMGTIRLLGTVQGDYYEISQNLAADIDQAHENNRLKVVSKLIETSDSDGDTGDLLNKLDSSAEAFRLKSHALCKKRTPEFNKVLEDKIAAYDKIILMISEAKASYVAGNPFVFQKFNENLSDISDVLQIHRDFYGFGKTDSTKILDKLKSSVVNLDRQLLHEKRAAARYEFSEPNEGSLSSEPPSGSFGSETHLSVLPVKTIHPQHGPQSQFDQDQEQALKIGMDLRERRSYSSREDYSPREPQSPFFDYKTKERQTHEIQGGREGERSTHEYSSTPR